MWNEGFDISIYMYFWILFNCSLWVYSFDLEIGYDCFISYLFLNVFRKSYKLLINIVLCEKIMFIIIG